MQGFVDLVGVPQWDAEKNTLSGTSKVIGGQTYQVILAGNGYQRCIGNGRRSDGKDRAACRRRRVVSTESRKFQDKRDRLERCLLTSIIDVPSTAGTLTRISHHTGRIEPQCATASQKQCGA